MWQNSLCNHYVQGTTTIPDEEESKVQHMSSHSNTLCDLKVSVCVWGKS